MKITHAALMIAFPLLTMAGLASAAGGLQPYTATYKLIRNGDTIGDTVFTLKRTADGWDYESTSHGTHGAAAFVAANIDEGSLVGTDAGKLEMRKYHYRLSSMVSNKVQTITANPATNSIAVHDKHDRQYPMQSGVLDKLSLTLAIAQDLAAGKHGVLEYPVAGRDHIEMERYQVGKQQTVAVPAGSQHAIAVARVAEKSSGSSTAYWFGLDNGFVPVRIVHTESNGEVDDLQLASLQR